MNRKLLITSLAVAGLLGSSVAQPPPPVDPNSALIQQTVKDIKTQQAQIAENQGKIDEKLATLAEAIRVARLYSSRGGH